MKSLGEWRNQRSYREMAGPEDRSQLVPNGSVDPQGQPPQRPVQATLTEFGPMGAAIMQAITAVSSQPPETISALQQATNTFFQDLLRGKSKRPVS